VVEVSRDLGVTVRLEEGREISGVPAALIRPAGKERLILGDVVRAGIGRELPFGRVTSVEGERVVVRTVFLGELREASLARHEVLKVPSGMEMATPVVLHRPAGDIIGSLIALDQKHRWVLGPDGLIHRVPWTDVKELSVGRPLAPGDSVRAALPVSLRTVTVAKIIDAGLRYEVAWEQTRRAVVCFASIAPL
jgi:hypothetical protein